MDIEKLKDALDIFVEVSFTRAISKIRFGSEDTSGGYATQNYPVKQILSGLSSWNN